MAWTFSVFFEFVLGASMVASMILIEQVLPRFDSTTTHSHSHERKAAVTMKLSRVGIDLAMNVYQAHVTGQNA
jgi:hypothetical protein